MKLIDKNDALIVWTEKHDVDKNFVLEKFDVIFYDFSPSKISYMSKFQCSHGNVNSYWKDANELELFGAVFRIFASLTFKDKYQKIDCLLRLGQIKELKELRFQLRVMFDNDLSVEEFDEKYYNSTPPISSSVPAS